MAEDSDLEKTEQPSPRKLEKAREEGDVPRSRELGSFTLLMAASAGFWFTGSAIVAQLQQLLHHSLDFDMATVKDHHQLSSEIWHQLLQLAQVFAPLLILLVLAALGSPALVGGWLFNTQALLPDFSRLNPWRGIGHLFAKNAWIELIKALAKTSLIALIAWVFLDSEFAKLFALSVEPLPQALSEMGQLLRIGFTDLVAGLAVIAMLDAPYQRYRYTQKLMMTKQELRDEAKESEGNPEIKAKLRAQQREMARRRMMSQVPSADVIVTNPTHYAVALKYPEHSQQAPLVIAKGVDQIAAKIREIAAEQRIVVMEAPALARALYRHTELETEIPPSLYTAVAQVLAYVFQLRDWQHHGGEYPRLPDLVSIPTHLDPLHEAGAQS